MTREEFEKMCEECKKKHKGSPPCYFEKMDCDRNIRYEVK